MRQLSTGEVRDFATTIIDEAVIEVAVQWIAENLSPDDVFSEDELACYAKDWATDNGWTDPSEAYPHWTMMTEAQRDKAIRNAT